MLSNVLRSIVSKRQNTCVSSSVLVQVKAKKDMMTILDNAEVGRRLDHIPASIWEKLFQ